MAKQDYIYIVNTSEGLAQTNETVVSYHKTFNGALAKVQEVEQAALAQFNQYKQDGMAYDAVHTKGQHDPKGVWSHVTIYRQGAPYHLNGIVESIWISRKEVAA